MFNPFYVNLSPSILYKMEKRIEDSIAQIDSEREKCNRFNWNFAIELFEEINWNRNKMQLEKRRAMKNTHTHTNTLAIFHFQHGYNFSLNQLLLEWRFAQFSHKSMKFQKKTICTFMKWFEELCGLRHVKSIKSLSHIA